MSLDRALKIAEDKREAVRKAVLAVALRTGKQVPPVREVRKEAGVGLRIATDLLRLVRDGKLDPANPWTDGALKPRPATSPPGLSSVPSIAGAALELAELQEQERLGEIGELIRQAETDEHRAEIMHHVAALVATKQLSASAGNAVSSLLRGATQAAASHRKANPPERDDRAVLLATRDAIQLARSFDGIASEDRRLACMEFVLEQVKADLEEDADDLIAGPVAGEEAVGE